MWNYLILTTTLERIIIIILQMGKLRHKELTDLGRDRAGIQSWAVRAESCCFQPPTAKSKEQYGCPCCPSTLPPTWTLWFVQVASLSHLTSATCVWAWTQAKKQSQGTYHLATITSPWLMNYWADFTKLLGLGGARQWSNSRIPTFSLPEIPEVHYLPPFLHFLGPLCLKRFC